MRYSGRHGPTLRASGLSNCNCAWIYLRTSQSSVEGAPLWWRLGLRMRLFAVPPIKNVGRRSFQWFAYRLPSAIFVYRAPIGLHEKVTTGVPTSVVCLTSLKICCAVARQLHGHLKPANKPPLIAPGRQGRSRERASAIYPEKFHTDDVNLFQILHNYALNYALL